MAEAFVNHFARKHGLDVRAESAGTVGGSSLNPLAVRAMEEIGIPMTGQVPKILTSDMLGPDTEAITMGCGVDADACPAKFVVSEDWGLDDPAGRPIDEVRRIRDEIGRRVREMLQVN